MGWNFDNLKAAYPKAPEKLLKQYYRARQQEAGGASRAEQARKKIEEKTGKPFGKRKWKSPPNPE
jgi:hypothetical protein